jgi:hypothetical protein
VAQAAEWFDPAQYGCMYYVIIDPSFWFLQVCTRFSHPCLMRHRL